MAAMDWNDKLAVMANLSFQFHRSGPQSRIDWQRTRMASPRVEECAVIAELAVAKELSQHRKRARREDRVDEWLLPVQCLNCGATRERIFSGIGIHNLRIQLAYCAQALCLAAIPPV